MKLKKLVLMGLVCCTVFASRGMAVLAEGADGKEVAKTMEVAEAAEMPEATEAVESAEAETAEVAEVLPDAALPEDEADETVQLYASEQGLDEAAVLEMAAEEVANLTSILESSITSSVSATIENEQAKLPKYTQEELMYLSCIIYCEAGNQTKKGKIAVANVIMNRVESSLFDHVTTIKEAIYDCERWGRQFSPVYVKSNGKWTTKGSTYEKVLTMYKSGNYDKEWKKEQMEGCIEAAKEALEGKKVIDGSYLYFNMQVSTTKAKCDKKGASYTVIGCHIFF